MGFVLADQNHPLYLYVLLYLRLLTKILHVPLAIQAFPSQGDQEFRNKIFSL